MTQLPPGREQPAVLGVLQVLEQPSPSQDRPMGHSWDTLCSLIPFTSKYVVVERRKKALGRDQRALLCVQLDALVSDVLPWWNELLPSLR